MNETATFEERVLDAADALFYAHGFHGVGMDRIRAASGVTLRRLYQCFPSKGALVEAYLRRRDTNYRAALAAFVDSFTTPRGRLLGVFDWMNEAFDEPGFRGCAFLNAYSEIGTESEAVAQAVRDSKNGLREYLAALARDTGAPGSEHIAEQFLVLFDGAASAAAVRGSAEPARYARAAAEAILDASDGAEEATGGAKRVSGGARGVSGGVR